MRADDRYTNNSHTFRARAVDLHVHSCRSDGTLTPAQLVDYAMEKGLAAFALTDHDTVDGLEEAAEYAQSLRDAQARASEGARNPDAAQALMAQETQNPDAAQAGAADGAQNPDAAQMGGCALPPRHVPEVIPGIELSTEYQGQDVHILGLYIDPQNTAFQNHLRAFVDSRTARNRKMCERLREYGIQVTYEDLLAEFPGAVITRAHYAKFMLSRGYIGSLKEAFERFIGDHAPCFIPREKVTPKQAVRLILEAGGVPVLAHPTLYHMSDERLDILTAQLKDAGLLGIEAVYSTYSAAEERQMRALADKYGLLISGGSDFHGANKPGLDLATGYGKLFVPYTLLDAIKQYVS